MEWAGYIMKFIWKDILTSINVTDCPIFQPGALLIHYLIGNQSNWEKKSFKITFSSVSQTFLFRNLQQW